MNKANNLPIVSVAVIAYNSSEYIIDTLNSIKNQTYQNLELVISDDCSTDNTIEICNQWVKKNRDRFTNVAIITASKNTGLSPNYNRAINACSGTWIKEIDAHDKLLPDCIADFINYTIIHPEAKYIFAKVRCFGADETICKKYENVFKYEIFLKTSEEQLHYLIYCENFIPSQGSFFNKEFIAQIGFHNDERLPMIEDWPKWITLLQKGVKFYFMDKYVADYRVSGGVSTSSNVSPRYLRSLLLLDLYYRYPVWIKDGNPQYIDIIANRFLAADNEILRLRNTHAYRLGKFLLRPASWFKQLTSKK